MKFFTKPDIGYDIPCLHREEEYKFIIIIHFHSFILLTVDGHQHYQTLLLHTHLQDAWHCEPQCHWNHEQTWYKRETNKL